MAINILKHFACCAICCFALFGTLSCNSGDEPEIDNTRIEIPLTPSNKVTAEQISDFNKRFTREAFVWADTNTDKSGNVIVSPFSVSLMLGMIANGLEQDDATKIAQYMGVSNINELNTLSKILLENLPKADKKSKVNICNSIWIADNYTLNPTFNTEISENFLASVKSENLSNTDKALELINNWIKSKTSDNFSGFMSNLSPDVMAIFLNTLVFDGEWSTKFDPANTKQAIFHAVSGDHKIDMMSAGIPGSLCARSDNFKACKLFFGNAAFSLTLILPNEELSLQEASTLLTPEEIKTIWQLQSPYYLNIKLPKFTVKDQFNLTRLFNNNSLKWLTEKVNLTMFEPNASGAAEMNQSNVFSISEKGAKVETVTDGILVPSAPPSFNMTLDKPFFFFLEETTTEVCLLSGRISEL